MDKTQAAKDFLAGVLAKVPEASRAQVQAALEAPEALSVIGDGVIRQEDYSRNMNALAESTKKNNDYYAELQGWHTTNKELVELGKVAKAAGGTIPVVDPNKPAPTGKADITKADVDSMLDAFGRDAAGFVAATQTLAMQHMHKFGEVLDLRPLLEDKRIKELGLQGVYTDVFKDKLAAKEAEATAKATATLRAEIEAQVRREFADKQIPGGITPSTGASPLDVLSATIDPTKHTAEAAAQEYNRLGAARSATP